MLFYEYVRELEDITDVNRKQNIYKINKIQTYRASIFPACTSLTFRHRCKNPIVDIFNKNSSLTKHFTLLT